MLLLLNRFPFIIYLRIIIIQCITFVETRLITNFIIFLWIEDVIRIQYLFLLKFIFILVDTAVKLATSILIFIRNTDLKRHLRLKSFQDFLFYNCIVILIICTHHINHFAIFIHLIRKSIFLQSQAFQWQNFLFFKLC